MRTFYLCGLLLCLSVASMAQEFAIRRFRPLPNDITAFMNPLRDLNGEACALIKVVGAADFTFSTPLGIIKRQQEVGEIWLYVPNGSRRITIRHPQWGVLRDYAFSSPLESRMTYELVLSSPYILQSMLVQRTEVHRIPLRAHAQRTSPLKGLPQQSLRTPLPWEFLVSVNATAGKDLLVPGIRLAALKRHGFYLYGESNFSFPSGGTDGICEADGYLPQENYLLYYTGNTRTSHQLILAGGIHRILKSLYVYEGVGYGKHQVTWETTDAKRYENRAYSTSGWAAEAGICWRLQQWAISGGVQTHKGSKWNANLGLGMFF